MNRGEQMSLGCSVWAALPLSPALAWPVAPLAEPAAGLSPALTTSTWSRAGPVLGAAGPTSRPCRRQLPNLPNLLAVPDRVSGCSRQGLVLCWGRKLSIGRAGEHSEPW